MPPTNILNSFLAGAIFIASVVIALLFWRSWKETRDRLFKLFSVAFALLGAERVIFVFLGSGNESIHLAYLIRLLAFGIIIWAIVEKNRSPQH